MAQIDAQRVITMRRAGFDPPEIAVMLGTTLADIQNVLRDPDNHALPSSGGGAVDSSGLLVVSKHLENNYAIQPATFNFSQAQSFGPPVTLQSDHLYEVFIVVLGEGAPGRASWEVWLTGIPDVVSQSNSTWDASPDDVDAPFPTLYDQDLGTPELPFRRLAREAGYVKTGGALQPKVRITDGAANTGGTNGQAASALVLSRFMVVVTDLSL